jgi:hypothetical protein
MNSYHRISISRTGELGAIDGRAAGERESWMTCRLLRHRCKFFSVANVPYATRKVTSAIAADSSTGVLLHTATTFRAARALIVIGRESQHSPTIPVNMINHYATAETTCFKRRRASLSPALTTRSMSGQTVMAA